jgi:ALIX V-shaped domain binding to HIV
LFALIYTHAVINAIASVTGSAGADNCVVALLLVVRTVCSCIGVCVCAAALTAQLRVLHAVIYLMLYHVLTRLYYVTLLSLPMLLHTSQEEALRRVLSLNEAFQEMRANDPQSRAREALMGQLNTGVEAYHAAHSQLSEGVIFYGDLLRRLAQLAQTAEDMVYTRGKS